MRFFSIIALFTTLAAAQTDFMDILLHGIAQAKSGVEIDIHTTEIHPQTYVIEKALTELQELVGTPDGTRELEIHVSLLQSGHHHLVHDYSPIKRIRAAIHAIQEETLREMVN